jgi:transposase-like protein
MERRKFTREFKLEAVCLIKDRGVSYVQASQDLGVHPSQLRDWVKKFADDPQHALKAHFCNRHHIASAAPLGALYWHRLSRPNRA